MMSRLLLLWGGEVSLSFLLGLLELLASGLWQLAVRKEGLVGMAAAGHVVESSHKLHGASLHAGVA